MFKQQIKGGRNLEKVTVSSFGGLNTAASCRDNEFCELLNLTNIDHPYLKTIAGRKQVSHANQLLAKDPEGHYEDGCVTGFKLNNDGSVAFQYGASRDNSKYKRISNQNIITEKQEQFIMAGGQHLLFPRFARVKLGVDSSGYVTAQKFEAVESELATSTEPSHIMLYPDGYTVARFDSSVFKFYYKEVLASAKRAIDDGTLAVGDGLKIIYTPEAEEKPPDGYSQDNIYIITAIEQGQDRSDKYGKYICLTLDTRDKTGLPVSHGEIELDQFNLRDQDVTLIIYKINPFVLGASFGGRLFACDVSGNAVWASQYGDVLNFRIDATDAGASIISCGEPARWTAIKVYGESVYAFKHDSIYRIDGSGALSYTLTRISDLGALNQAAVAVVGDVLYFMHKSGIYAYSGGELHLISDSILKELEGAASAVLGGTGHTLYCAVNYTDTQRLFVYNGKNGLWHEELAMHWAVVPIEDMIDYAGKVHAATEQWGVYILNATEEENSESDFPFRFVTKKYFYLFDKKAVGEVAIKMSAENPVTVSVSYDGGEFTDVRTMTLSAGIGRVPVKLRKCTTFQIKVEGWGEAEIHAMEFSLYRGGRWF